METEFSAEEPNLQADQVRSALASFLNNNPFSELVSHPSPTGERHFIERPWGDSSVRINLPREYSEIASVLNNVILPQRFSAIYHIDSRKLEIIWTAFTLSKSSREIVGRAFGFRFRGSVHRCEFGRSSDRLLIISKRAQQRRISATAFRNLQSFTAYTNLPEAARSDVSKDGPLSFWISDLSFDENAALELAANLNFYLNYYDDACPTILVHELPVESSATPRNRYIRGNFPEMINADRCLDPNLLSFWNFAAGSANPMINFILFFRIIEYAAFHYVDAVTRAELRRIIMAPDFAPHVLESVERIVGAVSISKLEEVQRFKGVLQHCVSPSVLWPDVQANISHFAKSIEFEGGFTIKSLVALTENEDTFKNKILNFAETVRKIRNTLSHGKDQETAGVILPTPRNFALLEPWVHLMATAAGEVIMNKDVT